MIEAKTAVREIAVRCPETLSVFDRHRIDYCCGGGDALSDAAARSGMALAELTRELEQVIANPPPAPTEERRDWNAARLSELTDHIVRKHHTFIKANLPDLSDTLDIVARVHGPNHGDVLAPLQEMLESLRGAIEEHLRKEEESLFPAVKELERGPGACSPQELPKLITDTVAEHETVGELLHSMRDRTSDYALPKDACPTFARLYRGLEALEGDVHHHIHLENNILFPRVLSRNSSARS